MDHMRLVFPEHPDVIVDPRDPSAVTDALRQAYPWRGDRRWLRANMVVTVDGRAQAGDGRTGGISSPEDKAVFSHLRADCDVVLVGAGTARTERYRALRPKPAWRDSRVAEGRAPAPCLAIVSTALDLDLESDLFMAAHNEPDVAQTIVLTTGSSSPDRRRRLGEVADVVICGDEHVDPLVLTHALEERGLRRILCEGGPRLLTTLLEAGVVDELDLTISPMLLMHPSGGLLDNTTGPEIKVHLAHTLAAESTLMVRYLIEESTPAVA